MREVWAQIRAHLINRDAPPNSLPDSIRHASFLDPAIRWNHATGQNSNATPLLVNTVGSYPNRPSNTTKIPNMFLAGDYVKTNVDLATMEGANESGRAAVNALLDAAGSSAQRVTMYKLYVPPEYDALKAIDAERYAAGQPNLFDT
jgi:phytoene dehydrogenase-like protein